MFEYKLLWVITDMPVYFFGMYLLQQMTLAAMFSWCLAPLVSKEVKLEPESPPLPFREASPPRPEIVSRR